MHLRNGDHGYGAVTKLLHWLTVVAIAGQFLVGYTMDLDGAFDRRDDRLDALEERLEQLAEGRGEAAEERVEAEIERREAALDAADDGQAADVFSDVITGRAFTDGVSLPELHIMLGLLIILLAAVRLLWRSSTPLPPWAEYLGPGERAFEAWAEKVLLGLLFAVPGTGLLLVVAGDEWVGVHIAAHIAFYVAIALHVALVLKHTVVRRDRHLSRML